MHGNTLYHPKRSHCLWSYFLPKGMDIFVETCSNTIKLLETRNTRIRGKFQKSYWNCETLRDLETCILFVEDFSILNLLIIALIQRWHSQTMQHAHKMIMFTWKHFCFNVTQNTETQVMRLVDSASFTSIFLCYKI